MPPGREADARAFYAGVLGMTELEKPATLAARGGCWFRAGTAILHLGVEEPFTPAKKAHPALQVTDLDALQVALESAGASVVPDDTFPGVRRFFTADPFGNRIELIAARHHQSRFEVCFQLTKEDLVEYTLHMQLQPAYKRLAGKWTTVPVIAGVLLGVTAMQVSRTAGLADIMAICVAVACIGVYTLAVTQSRRRVAMRQVEAMNDRASLLRRNLAVDEAGIDQKTELSRARLSWQALVDVQRTKHYLFLFLDAFQAIPIPTRCFATKDEADRFYSFVHQHLERQRACRKCGYDLTGNQSGRCPECGELA